MQPSPNPADLQLQASAMTLIADLNLRAFRVGATLAPLWSYSSAGYPDGSLRSDDDTAIRELDIWRELVGQHRIRTYTYANERFEQGRPRRVWVVEATVRDVSIRLVANVPASVDARPANVPARATATALAVAA